MVVVGVMGERLDSDELAGADGQHRGQGLAEISPVNRLGRSWEVMFAFPIERVGDRRTRRHQPSRGSLRLIGCIRFGGIRQFLRLRTTAPHRGTFPRRGLVEMRRAPKLSGRYAELVTERAREIGGVGKAPAIADLRNRKLREERGGEVVPASFQPARADIDAERLVERLEQFLQVADRHAVGGSDVRQAQFRLAQPLFDGPGHPLQHARAPPGDAAHHGGIALAQYGGGEKFGEGEFERMELLDAQRAQLGRERRQQVRKDGGKAGIAGDELQAVLHGRQQALRQHFARHADHQRPKIILHRERGDGARTPEHEIAGHKLCGRQAGLPDGALALDHEEQHRPVCSQARQQYVLPARGQIDIFGLLRRLDGGGDAKETGVLLNLAGGDGQAGQRPPPSFDSVLLDIGGGRKIPELHYITSKDCAIHRAGDHGRQDVRAAASGQLRSG